MEVHWPQRKHVFNLICRVYQSVNRDEKNPLGFSNSISLEDKSMEFSVSHPSMVSQTCLATHFITDTKWIRNSIWKIRNVRRTRNTKALAKSKQERISHNKLFQALTFKATRIYRYDPLDRNINSTTTLVHRTTVHMWRWFNSSDYFVCLLWLWSHKKTLSEFCVNPQPFALQYKHNHSTEWHTSINCVSYVRLLFLNLIKSGVNHRSVAALQ